MDLILLNFDILVLKYSGKGTITNIKKQTNRPFKASHFDKSTMHMKSKSFATKEEAAKYLQQFTDKDKIVEIEVKDYLKMSKSLRKELKGIRTGVEFPTKQVDFDPYIMGLWFGDGTSRDSKITTQDARILTYLRKELVKYDLMLNYESKYDYRISSNGKTKTNIFLMYCSTLINFRYFFIGFNSVVNYKIATFVYFIEIFVNITCNGAKIFFFFSHHIFSF